MTDTGSTGVLALGDKWERSFLSHSKISTALWRFISSR